MSNPLAEYLSAIEARDAQEKAHEEYINACECFHEVSWSRIQIETREDIAI
jgi:hypothetical protein